jgi:hypothetical protein
MLAGACAVLWLLAAALRHVLGAPQSAGFISTLLTPPIVAARWLSHVPASAGWWLALGVLLLGALWHFAAPFLKRRGGDAVFSALLAMELFWLLRWYNTRLSAAGAPSWDDLSHAQQICLVLGVLVIVFLIGAALLLPATRASYENSAPTRVTSFMKKRRLPSRIAGLVLMMLAIGVIAFTAFQLEAGVTHEVFFGLLSAPLLFIFWIVLDAIYYLGRRMWRRLA